MSSKVVLNGLESFMSKRVFAALWFGAAAYVAAEGVLHKGSVYARRD